MLDERSRTPCASGGHRLGRGVKSDQSCSGGHIQRNGGTICYWSTTRATTAQSSGKAELTRTMHGDCNPTSFGDDRLLILSVGATACNGMLVRSGIGTFKHLSTT